MYSIVLTVAMTATAEAPNFGNTWAKHCFWECCLPARYGWVPCGPGYQAYYPASYTSCYGCGCGGYSHHHSYSHGCGCGGCWSSCHGCGGCFGGCGGCWGGGCGGCGGGCIGGYYNCYGGGFGGGGSLYSGIGYAGFGAYGNYGNYGTVPVYSAPVYASPVFDAQPQQYYKPTEAKPVDMKPLDIKPIEIKPTEIKPIEIKPSKTMVEPAKASVVVRVPAKAKVYIDDNLMTSTSTERKFSSPAIEPGASFYYTIRVVVDVDGKEVEDVRRVTVKAGEVSRLDFDNLFDRQGGEERTVVDAKNLNSIK